MCVCFKVITYPRYRKTVFQRNRRRTLSRWICRGFLREQVDGIWKCGRGVCRSGEYLANVVGPVFRRVRWRLARTFWTSPGSDRARSISPTSTFGRLCLVTGIGLSQRLEANGYLAPRASFSRLLMCWRFHLRTLL